MVLIIIQIIFFAMKKIKKVVFLFILSGTFFCSVVAQSFYDNSGKPILFYNSANNTLFDFLGSPLFYFTFDNLSKINMYDFEGHHIAWLSEGILRDHEGKILASQRGRVINISYSAIDPIKPIEKIIPIKKVEQIPPIQPIFVNQFSSFNLLSGSTNSPTQNSTGYLQNDYSSVATFRPYELPGDAIFNALKALNARHNRLISQGYIYDERTDTYYTKEQYAELEAKRNIISQSYYEVIAEAKKINPLNFYFKKPKRKTYYNALFGSAELGVFSAKILIKRSGKIRGFYFTHPQYGYMFFGLKKKQKITFPYNNILFIGDISRYKRKEVGRFGSAFLNGSGTLFWHRGLSKTKN